MMQRDTELAENEIGDALGCPQLVGPAMCLGALKQQPLKLGLLGSGQACGSARMWFGSKSRGGFGIVKPAIDGTFCNAHDASDILYLVALLDGLNGLASPLFQSAGRSVWSAHVI